MIKLLILGLFSFLISFFSVKQQKKQKKYPDIVTLENKWVDSVFNSLDANQRLGQLFMVAAYSNKTKKDSEKIAELITKYHIGGLIWMQGGPLRQAVLANYYQNISKTPLIYSIDAEWGLAMRLDSTIRYPKQMTLGAIQNDSLIYSMGKEIGLECKRLGIHINFAPVVDINSNPLNPVIGNRSFGENKYQVAQKALMYMKGLQEEHVLANGKHFPGHGDTDSDSHKTLPYISHSKERLDSIELYPFQYLFDRGLSSVMVAHLNIPSIDNTPNLPSTLSAKVVTDLLKNKMDFKGLIFTDALNMKGASNYFTPGKIEVKAFLAGNDVLLFSENIPKAIQEINKAIKIGEISQTEIDSRCRKILKAKYWCGLSQKYEIKTLNLYNEINSVDGKKINDKLAEASITLLKNENQTLPINKNSDLKIIELSIGLAEENSFYKTLKNNLQIDHLGITHTEKLKKINNIYEKIKKNDLIIIQLNKSNLNGDKNYGISNQSLKLIDSISKLKPTVLVLATNPYILNKLKTVSNFKSILVSYESTTSQLNAAANAIIGINKIDGKLPLSTFHFKYGCGIKLDKIKEEDNDLNKLNIKKSSLIDSIALSGIKEKAYPGCQILAMKDGKIIFQKSFGNYTYDKNSKLVDNNTMYDLASITKIASTCLMLMKLNSEGKFNYKKTLDYYLPYLKKTNKGNILIEDLLSHQAGLKSWIPFYLKTIDKNGEYIPGYYSETISDLFSIKVAKNLYVTNKIKDTIYNSIIESKVENTKKYLYSDLGFYFIQKIIEKITLKPVDVYVKSIYEKIGLNLTYLPLNYFSENEIAPSENDEKFRKQILTGYVHDQGAALLGGIACHAGLFGNAKDLAKLMQLYLNYGEINGERILDSNVVKDFTTCHFYSNNRRGLCFDKPEQIKTKEINKETEYSSESFGHTGFTGTYAWADPKNKLIVVFLSNRVFENPENNKLVKLEIRSKLQRAFYDFVKN